MAEDKQDPKAELFEKLGTSVTYQDPDKTGNGVTMQGVYFAPGEAVDLAKFLPEPEAKKMAQKLAGNPYFRVQGGPDHQELLEERQKHEAEAEKHKQEVAQRQAEKQQRRPGPGGEPEAPASYRAPEAPTLEGGTQERQAPPRPKK